MKAKKGISLIVLVITIIVIIILAGAVILSLSSNNPINSAVNATTASNKVAIQSALTMYLSKLMADNRTSATVTGGTMQQSTSTAYATVGTTNYVLTGDVLNVSLSGSSYTVTSAGSIQ